MHISLEARLPLAISVAILLVIFLPLRTACTELSLASKAKELGTWMAQSSSTSSWTEDQLRTDLADKAFRVTEGPNDLGAIEGLRFSRNLNRIGAVKLVVGSRRYQKGMLWIYAAIDSNGVVVSTQVSYRAN